MKKHSYSWSDGVLFSFVLNLNLRHLIPMLISNSINLEFDFKPFTIIINKNTNITHKVNIIPNTTPLNH